MKNTNPCSRQQLIRRDGPSDAREQDMLEVVRLKEIYYRCRCSACNKETPVFALHKVPPGHEVKGDLVVMLTTVLNGRSFPEPKDVQDLHDQVTAMDIARLWRKQLKRAGCPHYLIPTSPV